MTSGSQRGTVSAIVPPGRTTRTSSPSANGSASASPSLTSASAPAGTSPALRISANMSLTFASSSASWSNAITSAPRRYISKACRPAPQPMSSVRSPGSRPSRSKSTVSNALSFSHGFLVRRGGGGGHGPPAEQLVHARPTGGAVPRAPLRVVEEPRQRTGQRLDVPGRHQVGAQPVGTDNLGDGPRVGD